MTERTPLISKELIEYLERVFPDKCPELKDSLDEVRFQSGQVAVVRHLRDRYEKQVNRIVR